MNFFCDGFCIKILFIIIFFILTFILFLLILYKTLLFQVIKFSSLFTAIIRVIYIHIWRPILIGFIILFSKVFIKVSLI